MVVGKIITSVFLVLAFAGMAAAQDPILEFGSAEVLPADTGVVIPLMLTTAAEVNAIDVGFTYNDTRATIVDVTLDGGALEGVGIESFEVTYPVVGEVVISLVLDSDSPYSPVIDGGDSLTILNAIFDVHDLQFAGTEIPLEFTDGLGEAELLNQAFIEGVGTETTLIDGMISIVDDDHLVIPQSTARVGDIGHEVSIGAFNVNQMTGFSVALRFDPEVLEADEFSIIDTITESVDAEFSASVIDNDEGTAIFGVLLDYLPPFEDQSIPASGIVLEVCRLSFNILDTDDPVDETELIFEDGLGDPPIDNVFVIEGDESIGPVLLNGLIDIRIPIPFIRGEFNGDGFLDIADPITLLSYLYLAGEAPECLDAGDLNDNGQIDIADPILLLDFLFQAGAQPPAPYPDAGIDPTPDDLACDQ